MTPATVTGLFAETVLRAGDAVALRQPVGSSPSEISWAEYARSATGFAAALQSLGLARGDRVVLMMRNRPEFWLADMGTLLAGGTPVSVYNSSPADRVAFVTQHAEASVAIVEDVFLERFCAAVRDLPNRPRIISVGDGSDDRFDDLCTAEPVELERAAAAVRREDLATVIYTSGTTGVPKGVMLTHANIVSSVEAYGSVMPAARPGRRQVSYLPMAHIAERLMTYYLHAANKSIVYCCRDLADLSGLLVDVQPEILFGTPLFWDRFQSEIELSVASEPKAFARARAIGLERFSALRDGGECPAGLMRDWQDARQHLLLPALKTVGLGDVQAAFTGASPLSVSVAEFFLSVGVPLGEAWGMSETTGTGTCSAQRIVPGTTGRPLPGVEIRLGTGDEILVRGPCVFQGYLNDQERTAAALDADGWLHTGDIGRIDPDGNLRIVDRLKEIIVPSSGHNVSPVQLEAQLKQSPVVAQACVVGNGRPYVVALIVLDIDHARALSRDRYPNGAPRTALAEDPQVLAAIVGHVAAINEHLPRAERVAGFKALSDDWLPDSEVLTPTGKLKRRQIEHRYEHLINDLYEAETADNVHKVASHR